MPACYSRVAIRGAIPTWAEPLKHQRFRIYVNGNLALEHQPGPGEFEITVPLQFTPEPAASVLRIECETAVIPSEEGLGPDNRRLAWRILSFEGKR
jgi:hypothetical protein